MNGSSDAALQRDHRPRYGGVRGFQRQRRHRAEIIGSSHGSVNPRPVRSKSPRHHADAHQTARSWRFSLFARRAKERHAVNFAIHTSPPARR